VISKILPHKANLLPCQYLYFLPSLEYIES
jgi:hypothetical protein